MIALKLGNELPSGTDGTSRRNYTQNRSPNSAVWERTNGCRTGLMEAPASVKCRAEGGFKYALLVPAVIWVIGLTFFPILAAVHYSFANYVLGEGITGYVGFDNYARLLTDSGFWYSIFITVLYVGITVPIEVCAGFILAWLITIGLPGKSFFRPVLTAPLFTMEVAIGYLGVTLFTDQGGLVSTVLGALGIHIPWLSTAAGGLAAAMILDFWIWTSFLVLMS